ncbi:hypothetical protein BJ138DRAFT_1116223 [Hygrophoropsis aurantiaca]|uniref:Uncharacterized protein n=1 Tax=Hygrophoropsis aurantiaca TaxID=72124 RepID=A0ACB8A3E3_9AGAM|nr:hypothetical protein BJ138DRAFT_1116223 [Hygrophoropsis aurantiaca]
MDIYYDYNQARAEITKHAIERSTDKNKKKYQLCVWDDGIASQCKPITSPGSRTTRFACTDAATKETEEAVFTVRGVLVDTDLPPLAYRPRPQQLRHMRQSITITGLGQSSFDSAVSSLYALQPLLARTAPPGAMEKWQPGEYKNVVSLDIQNRYFTLRRYADGAEKINFDDSVDPDGFLEDNNSRDLIHTEDNKVEYYASATAGAVKVSPSTFRAGDIVEASLSVEMTPVSNEKYKMILILRSLALINSTMTTDAETKRDIARFQITSQMTSTSLKRRRAYSPTPEGPPGGSSQRPIQKSRGTGDGAEARLTADNGDRPMESIE